MKLSLTSTSVFILAFHIDAAIAERIYGLIRSTATDQCWQQFPATAWDEPRDDAFIRPRECDMDNSRQRFVYDDVTQLLFVEDSEGHGDICVDADSSNDHFYLNGCAIPSANQQKWQFFQGVPGSMLNGILNNGQDVCAATGTDPGEDFIAPVPCDTAREHFQFYTIVKDAITAEFIDTKHGGKHLAPLLPGQISLAGAGIPVSDTKRRRLGSPFS